MFNDCLVKRYYDRLRKGRQVSIDVAANLHSANHHINTTQPKLEMGMHERWLAGF